MNNLVKYIILFSIITAGYAINVTLNLSGKDEYNRAEEMMSGKNTQFLKSKDSIYLPCKLYLESSNKGYSLSYAKVGKCYSLGLLGKPDNINYTEAEIYWKKSINAINDDKSKMAIAKSYLHLPSRPELYSEAISYLESLKEDDFDVKIMKCDAILSGKGVEQNIKEGMICLKHISSEGSFVASSALALIYKEGHFGQEINSDLFKFYSSEYEKSNILEETLSDTFIYLRRRCIFIPLSECEFWE